MYKGMNERIMFRNFGIQVDTSNFTEADLQAFCRILEEIQEKRQECERHRENIQQNPSKAVLTRREIFESLEESAKKHNSTPKSTNDFNSSKQMSPLNMKNKINSPKLRQQLIKQVDAIWSPKSSPPSKRRINYNKSIDCDIGDDEFHRLSVKEKALWYETNKARQRQSTFQVNRYSENESTAKTNYVKHLRDLWEVRLNTCGPSFSLKRQKKLNKSVKNSSNKEKSAKYEKRILKNWREELKLKYLISENYVSEVQIEMQGLQKQKSMENFPTAQAENTLQTKQDSEKPSNIIPNEIKPHEVGLELSQKRHHNILRSALITNEFMAPPKKIRRLDSHQLIDNPHFNYLSHSLLKRRPCVPRDYGDKQYNKTKGNTTLETLLLDELGLKFKKTVVLDDMCRQKPKEKGRINTSNLRFPGTITNDSNSSTEYPESETSVEPCSTNSEESITELGARKKKICRCLNGKSKQDDDYIEVKLNWTSDSDTEPKSLQTITLPSELNHNNSNNCANRKHYNHTPISNRISNHEFADSSPKSDKSFNFHLYSPKKVISVYTLTAMSTPTSTQSNVDTDHDEWSPSPEKQCASKGSPVIFNEHISTLDGDTYIDQGFETGSNDTQSPTRNKPSNYSIEEQFEHFAICSTPNRDGCGRLHHNIPNSVSPINVLTTKIEKQTSENPLTNNASEFWIAFGNYTLSLKIHHCPWERLLLLRKAFVQEQIVENLDINFGIDKQIFPLHSKSIVLVKELVQRLSKKDYNNCSHYWFCKGNVWLPFKGPVISTSRIRRIFTCLQAFRDHNDCDGKNDECLTFGIDNYVFFSSHKMKSLSRNSSKLSDLDYNDL